MKTWRAWPAGLILFGWIAVLLFAPPFAGLADNSDYARVLQPLGFVPNEHPRYAHAHREFTLTPAAEGIAGIIRPQVENELGYASSLNIPIKAAMLLNFAAKKLSGQNPLVFDIRWLGLLYAALYAAGLALFAARLGLLKAGSRAVLMLLSAIMLCDAGYILYFHSFYGEALSMAAGMLAVGSAVWLIFGNPARKAPLLLFYASCLLFIPAKVANAPLGALAALFGASLLVLRKDIFSRAVIVGGSAVLLTVSLLVYISAPDWMKQVNHYQSIFFGVLKDSPSPEADLRELGIPESYASLAGTHGYMPDAPHDIYGEAFQRDVYDRAPVVKIAWFYAKHPDRLLEKLRLSAESALPLRPAYLGNTLPGEGAEGRYSFTEKLSLWEPLRKRAAGLAFPIVLFVFLAYFAAIAAMAYRLWRTSSLRNLPRLAGIAALFASAAVQFAVPVIGNGEADLQKHMFLFNFCFDLLLVIALCKLFDQFGRVKAGAFAAALLALAVIAASCAPPGCGKEELCEGDTIQFGSYRGTPLEWSILARDENGLLLWSRRAVDFMPFDALDERLPKDAENLGSNRWAASDLRVWLNGPFLEGFSAEEKQWIRPVELKTLLSAADKEFAAEGDQPHFWNSHPLFVEQNADRAFAERMTERVFVLDAVQLQQYVAERGKTLRKRGTGAGSVSYWVRTPYASGQSEVRVAGGDGFIYHRDAGTAGIGVVPALYIDAAAPIASGSETGYDPCLPGHELPKEPSLFRRKKMSQLFLVGIRHDDDIDRPDAKNRERKVFGK